MLSWRFDDEPSKWTHLPHVSVAWQKVKNVPKLSKPLAIFCAVINIILPGSGTITAACMTPDDKLSKSQLIIGIL